MQTSPSRMRGEGESEAMAATSPGNRRVVTTRSAHQPDLSPVLVGEHPPAVVLFLVDPARAVKRLGDRRGVHIRSMVGTFEVRTANQYICSDEAYP